MSAYTGDIVKDGLVLCLDAGNIKSYSGTGTAWNDMSGQRNNAVLTNGPTYTALNKGAIILDGSNDCAVVNGNAAILSKTAYTKIAWFYVTSFSTANNIISGGNGAEHAFWMASTNKLNAGHNGSWSTIVGNTTLSLNTWYFGAVTYNSTTGWVLYLNGVQDATNGTTTTFNGTQEVLIGGYGTGANPFTGRISYALVYNRVLSAAEIRENYNATKGRYDTTRSSDAIKPRLSTSGLVLHLDAANYRSYPRSGTTWFDLSGNGTNASLENGTAYNSGNGGNMLLDGSNDQLSLSNNARLGGSITNFVTISSWFKFNALPVSGEVAIIRLDNQWQLGFVAGAVIRCLVKTTGGTDGWTAANDTSYPFSLNTWYNMTMVYNGSNLLIYVNSVLVKTATVTGTIASTSSGFVFMGRWTEYMNGNIANCQIYNRPLSAAEVRENFNIYKVRYGYVL